MPFSISKSEKKVKKQTQKNRSMYDLILIELIFAGEWRVEIQRDLALRVQKADESQ